MAKVRLDQLVVTKKLAESREKAKRLIMSGKILQGTESLTKPGVLVSEDIVLVLKEPERYVSRGGLKIEGFLSDGKVKIESATCLDIGSSTGGFTDFLLQNGAEQVTCVDVGYGVLHAKIRNDSRVSSFERVNARTLDQELVGSGFDLIVIDVSFISLKLIIPNASLLLKRDHNLVCLVKPQFEAGRKHVEKGGVVRSEEIQKKCVEEIINFGKEHELEAISFSPCVLKGPKGNQEYFIHFQKK